jgi:hypothetical protein
VACDGYNATLSCPTGQVLSVQAAFYGRNDTSTCVAEATAAGMSSASWNRTTCSLASALTLVQSWCSGKASCSFPNGSGWGSDPCNGTYKYGMVDYVCTGEQQGLQPW